MRSSLPFQKISLLTAFAVFGIHLPLIAGDPVVSQSGGKTVYADSYPTVYDSKYVVETSGKEPVSSLLLPDANLHVDVFAGATYFYDSNTTQLFNGDGASTFAFDYGFDVTGGNIASPGGFYGFNYVGHSFVYEDNFARAGRDPHEHRVGALLGVNGAKTSIRLDTTYTRSNGNTIDYDRIYRETRRAASDDFTFDVSAIRDLPHGSIETGFGYILRDFDAATLLNDEHTWFGDIAWYFEPGFAPKTSIGLGFRFGEENYDFNPDQYFYTPSLRARYQLSGKTVLHSSVGTEFRDASGPGTVDREHLVYEGGVSWAATSKTGFDFRYYRQVDPSYVNVAQDIKSTGLVAQMTHQLPREFVFTGSAGYEYADYVSTVVGSSAIREDDFFRLRASLGHPIRLTDKLQGDISVFYQYAENDSNIAVAEFEQHITGVRVGLVY